MINSFKELSDTIFNCRGIISSVDWKEYGQVNVQQKDDLILFSYKRECQYKKPEEWNWFERVSRGLVMNTQGEVVARPFDKFWNYGEVFPDGSPVEITEKVDGSLVLVYPYKGEIRTSTRGSFDSDQAKWASEYIRDNLDLDGLIGKGITLLCEAIYPDNQIVIDYKGREDLVLLGVRNREGGMDWSAEAVSLLADSYGMTTPRVYEVSNIDVLIEQAKELGSDHEGWVVRYSSGARVKVKGAAYLQAHKWISNLNPKTVAGAIVAGELETLRASCPEGLSISFVGILDEVRGTITSVQQKVLNTYKQVPSGTRKDYALWVNENAKDISHYMFAIFDGKLDDNYILKREFGV